MNNELVILNSEQLANGTFYTEPFHYGVFHNPFYKEHIEDLLKGFPIEGFSHTERVTGDKQYKLWHRTLIDEKTGETHQFETLAPVWKQLYKDIISDTYRKLMSTIIGYDLSTAHLGAIFWKYPADCFLHPHTDKPKKIVTHLIYLNPTWSEDWGGCLQLYTNAPDKKVVQVIPPTVDTSVLLVTSPQSWHSVAPVVQGYSIRKSLQIVFWRD